MTKIFLNFSPLNMLMILSCCLLLSPLSTSAQPKPLQKIQTNSQLHHSATTDSIAQEERKAALKRFGRIPASYSLSIKEQSEEVIVEPNGDVTIVHH